MPESEELTTIYTKGALNARGEPRCVRPWYFGWPVLLGGSVIVAPFCFYLLVQFGMTRPYASGLAFSVPYAMFLLVKYSLYDGYMLRLRLKAIEARLAMCLRCTYSLDGLPVQHRCPECGQTYDLEETKAHWRRWLLNRWQVSRWQLSSHWEELDNAVKVQDGENCIRCGAPKVGAGPCSCAGKELW